MVPGSSSTGSATLMRVSVLRGHGHPRFVRGVPELLVNLLDMRKFEWVFRSPQGEQLSTAVVVARRIDAVAGLPGRCFRRAAVRKRAGGRKAGCGCCSVGCVSGDGIDPARLAAGDCFDRAP